MSEKPVLAQKFGGTSVSTAERRRQVIDHVRRAQGEGYQVAIVVSAMGRRGDAYATDTLLDILRADGSPVDGRDYDMMFTTGEIISVAFMAHLLKREGVPAVGLTGAQACIYTDGHHREAEVVEVDPARMRRHLERGEVPVVTGGQGYHRETGDFTTLGRGGSDTSGVAVGVALKAEKVEIFSDVEGVLTADPRIIPGARILERINYDKTMEMARYGAKVVHPRAVRTGQEAGVPLVVRSTFSMAAGTIVDDTEDDLPVVGIATLGPLETYALDSDVLGPEKRMEWENRRGIMSLLDEESGALLLGATAEKTHDLRAAVEELGGDAGQIVGERCWVSLIGDSDALRAGSDVYRDVLRGAGIAVGQQEIAGLHGTYAIPAADQGKAVKALYLDVFGEG
jgi:uridylate kinase